MRSLLIAFATLFCCSFANAKKIKVVTSFSVLAALASEILSDQAEVTSLVRGNTDPHHFEPSIQDIQKLKSADLIIKNGFQFEPWMDKLLKAQNLDSRSVELTKGLTALPLPGTKKGKDPHAWLSAENALIYATNLRERVRTMDDLDQNLIDKNHRNFQERTQKLILEMKAFKNRVKDQAPTILSAHESLSYLGRELGLQVISVHSYNISDFDNSKKIRSIYQSAGEKKIAAAFAEKSVSSPLFDRIVKESGLKTGDPLYTESVPNISSPQAFSEMLAHNVQTIMKVLKTNP